MKKLWRDIRAVLHQEAARVVVRILAGVLSALGLYHVGEQAGVVPDPLVADAPLKP